MSVTREILGMNARNFLYIGRYNKAWAKRLADDKLETKKRLGSQNIPTASIIHTFITRKGIKNYSWDMLPQDGFAIKPSRGYGGEGILVFSKWDGKTGTTVSGKIYNLSQIKSHIFDIFDGIYSLQSLPDKAYIEERITPHPFFKKLAPVGVSDIRIIVFNKIPIMAMMRLPTYRSGGKANLHKGALGIGIGLRTGITNHSFQAGKEIRYIPGTKIKTSGIRIPLWDQVLLLASKAQVASGLGFAGVDIVFDKEKGPVVIEINARPGLSIQTANLTSLRSRLERVEDLNVATPERGVEIARSIFAEEFSDRVAEEKKILSVIEPVKIVGRGQSLEFKAKLDTGAYRTSLDHSLITALNLPILPREYKVISASGSQTRPAVRVQFELGGKQITTTATVASRSHLRFPLIIGRRDLKGFYVNPDLEPSSELEVMEEDHDLDESLSEDIAE